MRTLKRRDKTGRRAGGRAGDGKREKGMAFIFAMIAILMIASATAALMTNAQQQAKASEFRIGEMRAFEVAQSAVDRAVAKLKSGATVSEINEAMGFNAATWSDGSGGVTGSAANNGMPDFGEDGVSLDKTFEGGKYFVRATDDAEAGVTKLLVTAQYGKHLRRLEILRTTVSSQVESTPTPWPALGVGSGASLSVTGGVNVYGDVHSNGDVTLNDHVYIDGILSASGEVDIRETYWRPGFLGRWRRNGEQWEQWIGEHWYGADGTEGVVGRDIDGEHVDIVAGAEEVDIPVVDFDYYKTLAEDNGTYFGSDKALGGATVKFFPLRLIINKIDFNNYPGGVVYVDGDVNIHSGEFVGSGMIVASGDINISGTVFRNDTGYAALVAGDDVNITRTSGGGFLQTLLDLLLSINGADIDGIVYAVDDVVVSQEGFFNKGAHFTGSVLAAGLSPDDEGGTLQHGWRSFFKRPTNGMQGKVDLTYVDPSTFTGGGIEVLQTVRAFSTVESEGITIWRVVR